LDAVLQQAEAVCDMHINRRCTFMVTDAGFGRQASFIEGIRMRRVRLTAARCRASRCAVQVQEGQVSAYIW
jgi:hypothetical protein